MHISRLIFVSISLFFLAGVVTAVNLTPSTVSNSNAGWLVADGSSSSTITVHVLEGDPPIPVSSNAFVLFSLEDSALGTISPTNVTPASDGTATAVFTSSTKSGNATIHATIFYNDGSQNILDSSTFQRTDHSPAQTLTPSYQTPVPVGTVTNLTLTYTDQYNNRVDNRNNAEVHSVHLSMASSSGSGLFDGSGYVSSLDKTTDAEGNITVQVRVSTLAWTNVIQADPIGNIALPEQIVIVGTATNTSACTLTQAPPTPVSWPADGDPDHYFDLYYYVKDQYDNPVNEAKINLESSAGFSKVLTTNSFGIAYIRYNASDIGGVYTLTATTPVNSSILCADTGTIGYCSQNVEFTSMEPVQMVFSASPQTMVSADIEPTSKAVLKARVMDVKGNPVSEWPEGTPVTVTFSQGPVSYPGANGTYTETVASHLSATSATMGADGYAAVDFVPGTFAVYGQPGYNETATATSTVTATWVNLSGAVIQKNITFTWKNYPFLTINTEFSRDYGYVGDFLNVTIRITGDGAALQPKPIDVLLLIDNSGSMGSTASSSSMVSQSKAAAINFIEGMDQGKDRVAVLFYDKYSDPALSLYVPLTYDLDYAKQEIADYSRTATKGYHTRTRYALYQGITFMNGWKDRESVKAIIHLTDGVWSMEGDPLARNIGYDLDYLNPIYKNIESNRYGMHSFWAGTVNGYTSSYRYFSDLDGGTIVVDGYRTDIPNGQRCDNYATPSSSSCNGWGSDSYETTQLTRSGPVTYYTDAEFSKQNMSVYAKESGVRVYSIGFGSKITSDIANVLTIVSNSTGGYYKPASDEAALNALYSEIAGDLNEEASASTAVAIDMGGTTLKVSGASVDSTGYFNYTASPPGGIENGGTDLDSTFIYKYHINKDGSTTDYSRQVRDDTEGWMSNRKLEFDVGKMILNDVWQTTFALNLTKAGDLELFPDCVSKVTFVDSSSGLTQEGCIPSAPISVYEEKANAGFGGTTLTVENLADISDSPDPEIWKVSWDTTYTGDTVAVITIDYSIDEFGAIPKTIATISPIYANPSPVTRTQVIDTRDWEEGHTYIIRVSAMSYDGGQSEASIKKDNDANSGTLFIKLE